MIKTIEGPNGRVYYDHAPERVCIIGMGPSINDYMSETLTQELRPDHHDEVWGINMVHNAINCDVVFWMDDLKSQAELTPHPMFTTASVKTAFGREQVGDLIQQEDMLRYVEMIESLPEWITHERAEFIVEEFKSMLNGKYGFLPFGVVKKLLDCFNEDRKVIKPDPSRSLAGLIKVLSDKSTRHNTAVITATRYPDLVPNSVDYPVDEVAQIGIKRFGKPYLNNGVAMAIGYALWKGVKQVKLYGADFTYPNRTYAEGGRACVESWVTMACGEPYDMNVTMCPHTSMFDNVGDIGIYGYATQPEIVLEDGRRFRYGAATAMGSHYVPMFAPPDTTNAHLKQADSSSGPNYPMVPRHVEVAQAAVR